MDDQLYFTEQHLAVREMVRQFARDEVAPVAARLRRLLHWVGWQDVGGVMLSSVYEESRDHPPPGPGRWHRSIDFRHQPVRNRGW